MSLPAPQIRMRSKTRHSWPCTSGGETKLDCMKRKCICARYVLLPNTSKQSTRYQQAALHRLEQVWPGKKYTRRDCFFLSGVVPKIRDFSLNEPGGANEMKYLSFYTQRYSLLSSTWWTFFLVQRYRTSQQTAMTSCQNREFVNIFAHSSQWFDSPRHLHTAVGLTFPFISIVLFSALGVLVCGGGVP